MAYICNATLVRATNTTYFPPEVLVNYVNGDAPSLMGFECPDKVDFLHWGLIMDGVFQNGTTFHGPGQLRFECPPSDCSVEVKSATAAMFWGMTGIIALFACIVALHALFGFCSLLIDFKGLARGRVDAVEQIASCKDEKERLAYANHILSSYNRFATVKPFTEWPGEQKAMEMKCIGEMGSEIV